MGYIYMSRADIRREYGVKRITRPTKVAVYHRLEAEIATLGDWVNGETYYFAIPALDDFSIGGFYGIRTARRRPFRNPPSHPA